MQRDIVRKKNLLDIYMRKRAELVRFFTLRLGTAAEAEDLVQEIFLKISGFEALDEIRDPAAYLYRIGTNIHVDRVRMEMRLRRRNHEWHDTYRTAVSGQDVLDEPPPDDALDSKQRLARVLAAIDQLPPQCGRVFRLYKLDGLTHGEIAARLGISRSAVEKHVSLALKYLAEALT